MGAEPSPAHENETTNATSATRLQPPKTMPAHHSLRTVSPGTLGPMGVRLRFGVFSVLVVIAAGATALAVACGGDDGSGPGDCTGADCDGGASSDSTTGSDSPSGQDGNTPPMDGGSDADADSSVLSTCGDGGAPGTLDESFGDGGLVWLKYPTSGANAVAVQSDGKIVVGGYIGDKLAIARLLSDGSLDPSFGTAGLVQMPILTRNNVVKAVAVQPDGKIVSAAEAHATGVPAPFVVLRQLSDGGLDPNFGDAGVVLSTYAGRDALAFGIAVLPTGKIVIAGYSENRANPDGSQDYEVAQINSDGTPDTSFGSNGRATVDMRSTSDTPGVLTIANNNILVGGASIDPNDTGRSDISVARLTPSGTLDPAFGTAGRFISSSSGGAGTAGYAMTADGTGRALVGGEFVGGAAGEIAMLRVTPGGAADGTWGDGGLVTTDFSGRSDVAGAVLAQPDGRVIAVGTSGVGTSVSSISIVLARYSSSGALDPSFGSAGQTLTAPAPDTHLGAAGAVLDQCHVLVVGRWGYGLSSGLPQSAMGVARYRR